MCLHTTFMAQNTEEKRLYFDNKLFPAGNAVLSFYHSWKQILSLDRCCFFAKPMFVDSLVQAANTLGALWCA